VGRSVVLGAVGDVREDDAIDLGVRPDATGLMRRRRRHLTLAVLVLAALVGAFLVRPDRDAPVESASERGSDDLSEAAFSFDPRFRDGSPSTPTSSPAPTTDEVTTTTAGDGIDSAQWTAPAPASGSETPSTNTTTTTSPFAGREWIEGATQPVLISFDLAPPIAEAGTSVELSWRLLAREGIVTTSFTILDRAGRPVSWVGCPQGSVAPRIRDDQYDGWYGARCTSPMQAEPGDYWIAVEAEDALGQRKAWSDLVGPLTIEGLVADPPTADGPTLVSSSVSAAAASAGDTIDVVWRLRSSPGVRLTAVHITRRQGGSIWSAQCPTSSGVSPSSGDAHDGTYALSCSVPDDVAPGRYDVTVESSDVSGDTNLRWIGRIDVGL
jgi:hypothetical protein